MKAKGGARRTERVEKIKHEVVRVKIQLTMDELDRLANYTGNAGGGMGGGFQHLSRIEYQLADAVMDAAREVLK